MAWNTDCRRTREIDVEQKCLIYDVLPTSDHCDPCLLSLRHCSRDPTKHRVCLAVFDSVNGSDSKTDVAILPSVQSVASLALVSPGAVTHGVTLFFWKKVITFFTHRLHPHSLRLPSHRLSSVIWINSAAKNRLSLGCDPWMVSPGAVGPLVTPLVQLVKPFNNCRFDRRKTVNLSNKWFKVKRNKWIDDDDDNDDDDDDNDTDYSGLKQWYGWWTITKIHRFYQMSQPDPTHR